MKRIYSIIGMPLSGKSSLARTIAKNTFSCEIISAGDIARSLLKSPEDKVAMEKADMFQNEQLIRDTIKARIIASTVEHIILEGFPRSADQVNYLFEEFPHYLPIIIEARVGDQATLIHRAKYRARDASDTDPVKLLARIERASKNMEMVRWAISDRLETIYTILCDGTDEATMNQFRRIK